MMQKHLTGPRAGTLKYDLITALGVAGLHGSKSEQVSALRLITLLTARYNWRRDEVAIGQTELAKLWAVDSRTVIRELKRLKALRLLETRRSAARGRVAVYRLNMIGVRQFSERSWPKVGPDFEDRANEVLPDTSGSVVRVDFANQPASNAPIPSGSKPWVSMLEHLSAKEPQLYQNWYARLQFIGFEDGHLSLTAPSRFVARYIETHLARQLREAADQSFGPVERISIDVASNEP